MKYRSCTCWQRRLLATTPVHEGQSSCVTPLRDRGVNAVAEESGTDPRHEDTAQCELPDPGRVHQSRRRATWRANVAGPFICWGSTGRRFKSCQPDSCQLDRILRMTCGNAGLFFFLRLGVPRFTPLLNSRLAPRASRRSVFRLPGRWLRDRAAKSDRDAEALGPGLMGLEAGLTGTGPGGYVIA